MRNKAWIGCAAILVALSVGQAARADDVTGRDQILCAVQEVNLCFPGDVCDQGPPWVWNVPDFIEVDFAAKELRTTKASGENRKTPIRDVVRADGQVVVSGLQNGRAFTLAITEDTGTATLSMAAPGKGGVAFAVCTPMPAGR